MNEHIKRIKEQQEKDKNMSDGEFIEHYANRIYKKLKQIQENKTPLNINCDADPDLCISCALNEIQKRGAKLKGDPKL